MPPVQSKHDAGVATKALELRQIWRVKDADGNPLSLRVHFHSLGVHQKNRGGVYPSGAHCKDLMTTVFAGGFSKEEVANQFVVVEEMPAHEFAKSAPGT